MKALEEYNINPSLDHDEALSFISIVAVKQQVPLKNNICAIHFKHRTIVVRKFSWLCNGPTNYNIKMNPCPDLHELLLPSPPQASSEGIAVVLCVHRYYIVSMVCV